MKIILTGTTGFVGQEILSQCLSHPAITSIVVLSRRDLTITDPKLHVHRMTEADFLSYSDPQLRDSLRGADACIWTLGLTPQKASDADALQRVTIDYNTHAVKAFHDAFTAAHGTDPARPFRFVYFSGSIAERDQSRSLWFWAGFRRVRGQGENILLDYATANPKSFDGYVMRPALILSGQGGFGNLLRSLVPEKVRVEVLSRAAIDCAVQGHTEKIWENDRLARWRGDSRLQE